MEWIPEEIVDVIAGHLTAADLSNCCAVSVRWREVFGRDRLWRRHCDSAVAPYLAASKNVVQPSFHSPDTADSTLIAISPSRLSWMRERHLYKNWSQGHFKQIETEVFNPQSVVTFYKNDYILELENDKIKIWDVANTLSLHSEHPLLLRRDYANKVFEINGSDKIVIVQGAFVQVCSLNLVTKELKTIHLFATEESEKCSDVSDKTLKSLIESGQSTQRCTVVGCFLAGVAIKERDTPLTLSVWNVETVQKLKKEVCPVMTLNYFFRDVEFKYCYKTMNLLLTYILENREGALRYYQVYSLTQLVFLPFLKKFVVYEPDYYELYRYQCYISNQYVCIMEDRFLYAYNYNTSELVYTTAADGGLCCLQNNVVFIHDCSLLLVDLSSKTISAQLQVESYHSELAADKAILLRLVSNNVSFKFIITQKLAKASNVQDVCAVPVYLHSSQQFEVNRAGTKIVLKTLNDCVVIHFW